MGSGAFAFSLSNSIAEQENEFLSKLTRSRDVSEADENMRFRIISLQPCVVVAIEIIP